MMILHRIIKPRTIRSTVQGFTLIEILVAQLLGLILIGGALSLIRPSISLFEQSSAAAMVRESGRIAMDTLVEDIQQAGYRGCHEPLHQTSVIDNKSRALSKRLRNWAYSPFTVQGFDADETTKIDTFLGGRWNTRRFRQQDLWYGDVLLVQSVKPATLRLRNHDPVQHRISLTGDQRQALGKGNLIGISDCRQSTMLQIDRQNKPVFNAATNTTTFGYGSNATENCVSLNKDDGIWMVGLGGDIDARCTQDGFNTGFNEYQFAESSEVVLITNSLYYLGVQSSTNYPSLYRMSMASNSARIYTEVVAEGIENMRVRYGIDTDGDSTPDRYQSAIDVRKYADGWSKVVSVRLWLMATSVEQRGHSRYAGSVWFPDTKGKPIECKPTSGQGSDACPMASRHRPYRRVYHREIMLRNAAI